MHARARLIGTIAVGAALVVPIARADSPYDWPSAQRPGGIGPLQSGIVLHPDDRSTARGPGAIAAAEEGSKATLTRPDDRDGVRGPGAIEPATASSAVRRDGNGDARARAASTPTVAAVSRENRFDWGDAGIGAAIGMGAAVLFIGCAVLLVSQRSRARPA